MIEVITPPSDLWNQLLWAYHKCKKGKHKSLDVLRFEEHLGRNLHSLKLRLQSGTYRPKPLRCFAVDHPKPREIFAAAFEDRLIHHLLVGPLEKVWEPKFSTSSYACRRGLGPLKALCDIQSSVRSLSQGGRKEVFALHLDIKSFFVTIDRRILKDLYLSKTKDPWLKYLIEAILGTDGRINSFKIDPVMHSKLIPKEKSWYHQGLNQGIPIGSLTSQFGSNLYLNALDHFVKRQLKVRHYFRYMDDLLILGTAQEELKQFELPISIWLQKHRNQNLNHQKTNLVSLQKTGLIYLGFFLKQVAEPKEPLLILPTTKKKWSLVKALRNFENSVAHRLRKPHPLVRPMKRLPSNQLSSVNSHLGLMKHSRCYGLRKSSINKTIKRTSNLNVSKNGDVQIAPTIKIKGEFHSIRFK